MNLGAFIDTVAPIIIRYEGTVSSWIRSPAKNLLVNGHPQSLHLVGLAIDVVFIHDSDKEDAMAMAERFELVAIDKGDHVHIQVRS